MKKKPRPTGPSPASLQEFPELDFSRYGRGRKNPFARRMRIDGWELVHEGPTRASLQAMPEIDARVKGRRNPYAGHIATAGIELQVGRGRPRAGKELGPSVAKSVRLPPELWKRLEKEARAHGVALHAIVRMALAAWLEKNRAA